MKKFLTKEAVVFPVSVQDDKQLDGSHTLFARMSPFPTKKERVFAFQVQYLHVEPKGSSSLPVRYLNNECIFFT